MRRRPPRRDPHAEGVAKGGEGPIQIQPAPPVEGVSEAIAPWYPDSLVLIFVAGRLSLEHIPARDVAGHWAPKRAEALGLVPRRHKDSV